MFITESATSLGKFHIPKKCIICSKTFSNDDSHYFQECKRCWEILNEISPIKSEKSYQEIIKEKSSEFVPISGLINITT